MPVSTIGPCRRLGGVRGVRIRIVVANDLDPAQARAGAGGAEVYVGRLVAGLRADGHEVAMVPAPPSDLLGPLRDAWDPRARRLVRAEADRIDADVVHVHNFARELSASVLAVDRPLVHTVHDHHLLDGPVAGAPGSAGPRGALKRAKAVVDREVVRRRVDALVAVSPDLAAQLAGRGLGDATVISGFVDDPTGPPTPPGTDVLYVGRLAVEKRPELAVRAFAAVAARHPTTTMHLLGDGPLRDDVTRLVAELGLEDRVVLHGRVVTQAVADHLEQARVVVVPSARESFGLVVTEAMVAGRPVVASDIPPFRAQVTDGVDGWLADDLGGLAAGLDEALSGTDQARLRGAAAARSARGRATTTAAVARHLEVYRQACARHGLRAGT